MNNKLKLSAVVGFILYALAAFFCVSLLFVLLDFCGISAARFTALWRFGKLFTGVYGICSVLIPVFLLVAAFECFMRSWHVRNGVVLAGSVIPFFTLDAIEHICRMIFAENSGDALVMKLLVALLTGGIIVAIEYLVLSMIGEAVENAGKGGKSRLNGDEGAEEDDVAEKLSKDEEPESAESAGLVEKNESAGVPEMPESAGLGADLGIWSENFLEERQPEEKVSETKVSEDAAADELFDGGSEENGFAEGGAVESGFAEGCSAEGRADFSEEDGLLGEPEGEENPFAHIFDEQDGQEERWKEKIWEEPVFDGSGEIDESVADESAGSDESSVADSAFEDRFAGESAVADNTVADRAADEMEENSVSFAEGDALEDDVLEDGGFEPEDGRLAGDVLETEDWESEPESENAGEFEDDSAGTGDAALDDETVWTEEDEADLSDGAEELPEEIQEDMGQVPSAADEVDVEDVLDAEDFGETEEDFDLPDLTDEFMGGLPDDKALENVKEFFDGVEDEDDVPEDVVFAEDAVLTEDAGETEDCDDGFGDDDFDGEDSGELSRFIEQRNNSFASIFAQMDSDAAQNPVVDFAGTEKPAPRQAEKLTGRQADTPTGAHFDAPTDTPPDTQSDGQNEVEGTSGTKTDFLDEDPGEADDFDSTFSGYQFNPTAAPVVDSNGKPFSANAAAKNPKAPTEKKSSVRTGLPEELPAAEAELEEETAKSRPKLKIANYKIPVEGILQKYDNDEYWVIDEETKKKAEDLAQTLAEFNIEVKVTGIRKGPVVTMFEILPAPGVNVNRIRSLQDNIALRLAATSVRIVSPIPGKSAVGIEIPNKKRAVVSFREMMEQKNPAFEKMAIPVILGKDISGEPRLIDLAKTPHLLIAGSTGSGKSVCVNSLILSILYKRNPNLVKLILIDPKVVELKLYNDIPHLLTPVITEPKRALQSLQYCLCEMERRYALLDNMGVRDISSYNRRIEERHFMQEKLPYIVVIIDEFADLMATTGRELESIVARLTAMSRAVGIHLVLATQRPSVNVITGLIKANIPSRIAFMVASRTDSNIIIDQIGAEKLLGKGDMLYASATDPFPVRIQGTLVSDDEVEKVVDYVKQYGEPDYIDDEIFVDDEEDEDDGNLGLFGDGEDSLYDKALEIVVQSGKASASYLQRRLKIGYNRAARLVEDMEERGIVGPQNGSKPREVIYVP